MNAMKHVETPASATHMVETSLGMLHVLELGAGRETLVLWPSIFTDHHIYKRLVTQLGASYRFLLIDGPAHGQSEGGETEFTMDACAEAMARVMDQFGLASAVVGGTSWGGITAAHLALASPDRVKALILMNTPMQIDGARPGLKARFISTGARWMLKSGMFRNGVAKSFFTQEVLEHNETYAQEFHAMLKGADPSRLATAIRSVILRGSPLLPRMQDINAATLVVAGKADEMYPIAVQAEAALRAPNGHFAPVSGKHISVVEQPDQVATVIGAFIANEVTR